MIILEVCCGNLASVHAAVEGGAPRVELCSALELDGLTPLWEDLTQARRQYPSLKIHALIRPRAGDFCYSQKETDIIADQILQALDLGADGIVTGALTKEGDIDLKVMEKLMKVAVNVTFHRAFDVCRSTKEALEEIIGLGCSRILTSGQAPTAPQGTALLKELQEQAAGRIIIMPGCGVSPENCAGIIKATGCKEIHASASEERDGVKVTSAAKVAGILRELGYLAKA